MWKFKENRNRIKDENGVISIMMVIIIPILIVGVLMTYSLFSRQQQENKAHKIAYASSEAYLSRYNAYFFQQYGMLANFDDRGVGPIIAYYFKKNNLIDQLDEVKISITYETLDNPEVFREAILESAVIVVGNKVAQSAVTIFDQLSLSEKIKTINQDLHSYEKKLSKQFDKSKANVIFGKLVNCSDSVSGIDSVNALKTLLGEQYARYFDTSEQLDEELERLNQALSDPTKTMESFLEIKKDAWIESEKAFLEQYENYQVTIGQLEAILVEAANIEVDLESIETQIQNLKDGDDKKSETGESELRQLEALAEQFKQKIDDNYSEVERVALKASTVDKDENALIDFLATIAYQVEAAMSGIEIGSGELIMNEAFVHSNTDFQFVKTQITRQALMNEYFMVIFNSYDLNCPRKIDPQHRQTSVRIIKGEVEYLISGQTKEKLSISNVRMKIFAIRSAANILTLTTDKEKVSQISNATVGLPQPWRTVAFGAALLAWSSAESYADVNRLMKGEGFFFLKSPEQWKLDFDSIMTGTWNRVDKTPLKKKTTVTDARLYYLDYLRMVLLMQSESETLLRAMDLFEMEIQKTTAEKYDLSDFSRGHDIHLTWSVKEPLVKFDYNASELIFHNGFR